MSCASTFINIGCTHIPVHDKKYLEWVLQRVDEINPDVFVHNGDLIDADCVGKFAKGDSSTLKKEYEEANGFLDELNQKLGNAKRVLMQGNHDFRIFRSENKHLSELLDFRLHIPSLRDWQIFDYKQHPKHVFRLGQVTFCHGFGVTKRACVVESINLSGPNTLYCHSHTHRGFGPTQVVWGENLRLPYWYANTGTGISSNVEYFQTRDISNWNRGMLVGRVEKKKRDRPTWDVEFIEHSRVWNT